MAIPAVLINLATSVLTNPRFLNFFTDKTFGFLDSKSDRDTPVTVPQIIQEDPRYKQALITYFQNQASREQQLIENARLANQLKVVEIEEQRQISALQRDLMRELQAQEIEAKLSEIQTIWDRDNWFSKLSRQETEQILLKEQQQHRLLILVSPPKISADCPDSFQNNLSIEIRNQVKTFLSENYPIDRPFCPVEFYGDYFKESISDIDVRRLQQILGNIPTVMLYSDITDYQVNFNIGFWGVNDSNPTLLPLQPLDWEEMQETLKAEGLTERQSLRKIRQVIVSIHKLLAAFFTDWYYLSFDPIHTPEFYNLADCFPNEWVQKYIDLLKDLQKQQRQSLESYQQEILYRQIWQNSNKIKCIVSGGGIGSIMDLAVSPDGKTIASANGQKDIHLWEVKNNNLKKLKLLIGHDHKVFRVVFSPNGKMLATSDQSQSIMLWDLEKHTVLFSLIHSDWIQELVFTPDSKIIVSSSKDNIIKAWRTDTGRLIFSSNPSLEPIKTIAIHPDGKKLLANSGSWATIWDIETQVILALYSEHKAVIQNLAISPDGNIVVSGDEAGIINIWDFNSQKTLNSLTSLNKWMLRFTFSPDGQFFVSGCRDNSIQIWESKTGELLQSITGHRGMISRVIFASDSKTLVSGSWDGSIKIWNYVE